MEEKMMEEKIPTLEQPWTIYRIWTFSFNFSFYNLIQLGHEQ